MKSGVRVLESHTLDAERGQSRLEISQNWYAHSDAHRQRRTEWLAAGQR
jgi:hypothetical protein